jgi:DNA-binding beta-propeller fold protein YncE
VVPSAKAERVSLLDLTGKAVMSGVVLIGWEPNAVALTSDGAFALVTNSADNTVAVVEIVQPDRYAEIVRPPPGNVVATVSTGHSPSGIAIAPDNSYALVSCLGDPNLTLITLGQWSTKAIPFGSPTSAVAIAPDGSHWVVTSAGAQSYVTVL